MTDTSSTCQNRVKLACCGTKDAIRQCKTKVTFLINRSDLSEMAGQTLHGRDSTFAQILQYFDFLRKASEIIKKSNKNISAWFNLAIWWTEQAVLIWTRTKHKNQVLALCKYWTHIQLSLRTSAGKPSCDFVYRKFTPFFTCLGNRNDQLKQPSFLTIHSDFATAKTTAILICNL